MIFFFHHCELPALLEQIRQQQHAAVAAHQHDQQPAANGHTGTDNNAQPPTDDSDQSAATSHTDTETRDVGVVNADNSQSHQLSSVNHTVQGQHADFATCSLLQVSDDDVFVTDSSVLTQLTATATSSSAHTAAWTSDEDVGCGSCAVGTAKGHHVLSLLSTSHEITDTALTDVADNGGSSSFSAVDLPSMELRRRHQTADRTDSSSSCEAAFTSGSQQLYTSQPTDEQTSITGETVSASSPAEVQQNVCNLLPTRASHTK